MPEFPANPADRTVFQSQGGIHYVFEASTQSWVKVTGQGQLFPLATPIANGLMAASDLYKVNRIVVPIPSSTITAEGCPGQFTSGYIGLYSADDYLQISGTPLIANNGVGGNYPFRITRNTAGFDFTLNKKALLDKLIAANQINLVGKTGKQGAPGAQGAPGGVLATGPQGATGQAGASPPCTATISIDPAPTKVSSSTNKAIVGLQTQQISDTEYNIVVQMGVIGNPDAAPSSANAKCNDISNWVLVAQSNQGTAQQVYYIDMSLIIAAIQDKFESEIIRLQTGFQNIVGYWLAQMQTLFSAQEASLCCAITQCQQNLVTNTASDGADVAVGGGSSVGGAATAVGSAVSTISTAMSSTDAAITAIDTAIASAAAAVVEAIETGTTTSTTPGLLAPGLARRARDARVAATRKEAPQDGTVMTISGLTNVGTLHSAARITLPTGRYVVEVVDCCIKIGDEYFGDAHILYNSGTKQESVQIVRPGRYTSIGLAKHGYDGLTVEIDHHGGPVYGYIASSLLEESNGLLSLVFRKKTQAPKVAVGQQSCIVTAAKLAEYERAWSLNQCCGLVMRLAGQDYIIVKRPTEEATFDCPMRLKVLHGHPAIAWPTFDGKTFVKVGGDQFMFKIDPKLSKLATDNLRNGQYSSPKGIAPGSFGVVENNMWMSGSQQDLLKHFRTIVFPML